MAIYARRAGLKFRRLYLRNDMAMRITDVPIDYTAGQFWVTFASAAGCVALTAFQWWDRRNRASRSQIQSLDRTLVQMDHRLIELEVEFSQRPRRDELPCHNCDNRMIRLEESARFAVDQEDIEQIRREMGELTRQTADLGGTLKQMQASLLMIQDYLLRDK